MLCNVFLIICAACRFVNGETWYAYDDHEYLIVHSPTVKLIQNAEAECVARNATLARVKTIELHNFLVEKIGNMTNQPYSFFIGASRNRITNKFLWTDGTSVEDGQWYRHEPNNVNEHCVTMGWHKKERKALKWLDIRCSVRSKYICQRQIPGTTATACTVKTLSSEPRQDSPIREQTQDQDGYSLLVVVLCAVGGFVAGGSVIAIILLCCKCKRSTKETEGVKDKRTDAEIVKYNKTATAASNLKQTAKERMYENVANDNNVSKLDLQTTTDEKIPQNHYYDSVAL